MENTDLRIRDVPAIPEGIQWPVEARTREEAWQIMLRSGITTCTKIPRTEFEKLTGKPVK